MAGLVDYLVTTGVLKTPLIKLAFEEADRAKFMPVGYERFEVFDEAMSIGHGQTISQPYTVAFMLELLQPQMGQKILDVGSGSGWTTVLLAAATGRTGKVIGVEQVPELVDFGQKNLKKFNFPNAKIVPATNVLGLPKEGPFDRILVSAASDQIEQALVNQLNNNGRLVMPVNQTLVLVIKDSKGALSTQEFPGFVFVPLIK